MAALAAQQPPALGMLLINTVASNVVASCVLGEFTGLSYSTGYGNRNSATPCQLQLTILATGYIRVESVAEVALTVNEAGALLGGVLKSAMKP